MLLANLLRPRRRGGRPKEAAADRRSPSCITAPPINPSELRFGCKNGLQAMQTAGRGRRRKRPKVPILTALLSFSFVSADTLKMQTLDQVVGCLAPISRRGASLSPTWRRYLRVALLWALTQRSEQEEIFATANSAAHGRQHNRYD